MSVDPRRVIAADLEYTRGMWIMTVQYMVNDTVASLDNCFIDRVEAVRELERLDEKSYKADLIDAISNKEIDDADDEYNTISKALLGERPND